MSDREQEMPAQPLSKPNPDPSVATNDAVERAMKAERDYVDGQIAVVLQRLDGIDTATRLLQVTADKMPAEMANVVFHLRELVDERFGGVQTQFGERDTRSEREARDNTVKVDAAFAAQKEAASKQDEANSKAIAKSESATAEAITRLTELFRTTTGALSDKHDDLKERVGRVESTRQGAVEQRTETREVRSAAREGVSASTAVIGAVVALVAVLAALYFGLSSTDPVVVNPTVTVPTPAP